MQRERERECVSVLVCVHTQCERGGIAWGDIRTYLSPHPAYVHLVLLALFVLLSVFQNLLSVSLLPLRMTASHY